MSTTEPDHPSSHLAHRVAARLERAIARAGLAHEDIERELGWEPGYLRRQLEAPEEIRLIEAFAVSAYLGLMLAESVREAETDSGLGVSYLTDHPFKRFDADAEDRQLAAELGEALTRFTPPDPLQDWRALQRVYDHLGGSLRELRTILIRAGVVSAEEIDGEIESLRRQARDCQS